MLFHSIVGFFLACLTERVCVYAHTEPLGQHAGISAFFFFFKFTSFKHPVCRQKSDSTSLTHTEADLVI